MKILSIRLLFFLLIMTSGNCHSQDFNSFLQEIEIRDIAKLNKIANEELFKYKQSGNKYYLFNQRLVKSHIAKINGDFTEGIRHLILILEECNNCESNQIDWVKYHLAATLSYLKAYKVSQEYALPLLQKGKIIDKTLNEIVTGLVASNYFQLKDYEKAIHYYNRTIKLLDRTNLLMIASMKNNIGLCYQQQKSYQLALNNFYEGLDKLNAIENKINGDNFMIVLIEGNIGTTYHLMGQLTQAKPLLEKELQFYLNNTEYIQHTEGPISELFKIYYETEEFNKALQLIEYASPIEETINKLSGNNPKEPILINAIYDYYRRINNTQKALIYADKLNQAQKKYQNKIVDQTNELNEIIYKNQLNYLSYEVKAQVYKAQNSERQKKITTWILTSIIIAILILLWFVYYYMRQRRLAANKDSIIFEQKALIEFNNNILLKKELEFQQNNINSLTQNLSLKKETEKAFLSKINELKRNKTLDPEQAIRELQLSVNTLLGVDKRFDDTKINKDLTIESFKKKLKHLHPILTKSEIELCVLFNMKLSSKDIGAIKNMSSGTIRVYKTKIKSKLKLKESQSIENYLSGLVDSKN